MSHHVSRFLRGFSLVRKARGIKEGTSFRHLLQALSDMSAIIKSTCTVPSLNIFQSFANFILLLLQFSSYFYQPFSLLSAIFVFLSLFFIFLACFNLFRSFLFFFLIFISFPVNLFHIFLNFLTRVSCFYQSFFLFDRFSLTIFGDSFSGQAFGCQ